MVKFLPNLIQYCKNFTIFTLELCIVKKKNFFVCVFLTRLYTIDIFILMELLLLL